ncbi:TlpA family protein disulfide reductase [Hugenholtzia roseola]|uniref:TlpA family protein disulfide reductase n=1 Tax=Hugenholtzia roseola TaxID=1002 RepID=UPI0013773515|nr:TlpA disulfide reductase family protein [Hugenholtzia roseola]
MNFYLTRSFFSAKNAATICKTYSYFCLFLILFSFFSEKNSLLFAQTPTLLQGRIRFLEDKVAQKQALSTPTKKEAKEPIGYLVYNPDAPFAEAVQIPFYLDSLSEFKIKFRLRQPLFARFYWQGKPLKLFIHPGDSLWIDLQGDSSLRYSLRFEGLGAKENRYLQEFEQKFAGENQSLYPTKYQQLAPKQFRQYVDKKRKEQQRFLNTYEKNNPISTSFALYATAEIDYLWANELFHFPYFHALLNEKNPVLPDSLYYLFLEEIALESPQILYSDSYLYFLKNFLHWEYLKAYPIFYAPKTQFYYRFLLQQAEAKIKNQQVRLFLQSSLLAEAIRNGFSKSLSAEIALFLQKNEHHEYGKDLKEFYQKQNRLKVGSAAPDFSLFDIQSRRYTLENFKQKAVYLYFWSYGCTSCRAELYALRRLQEEFEKDEIVFVSVFLNENQSIWQKLIAPIEWKGLHLRTAEPFDLVVRAYNLAHTPTAVLLDKNHKLVYQRMRTPAQEGVKQDIEHLLLKK